MASVLGLCVPSSVHMARGGISSWFVLHMDVTARGGLPFKQGLEKSSIINFGTHGNLEIHTTYDISCH